MQGHQFLVSRPPLPEAGPLPADLASPASEAPKADESQDGDDVEESEEETSSSISPLPAFAEEVGVNKKRKCVDEITSSSFAAAGKAPVLAEGAGIVSVVFEFLNCFVHAFISITYIPHAVMMKSRPHTLRLFHQLLLRPLMSLSSHMLLRGLPGPL
jgi:hypothetical protein